MADFFLGPDEGLSFVVICFDVGIDVLLELFEACEGCAAKRLPLQDREPYLDLVEPGRACRREMKLRTYASKFAAIEQLRASKGNSGIALLVATGPTFPFWAAGGRYENV